MKKATIFFLLCVWLVGCSTVSPVPTPTNTPPPPTSTPVPGITHVYAFGDDSADIGNGLQAIKKGVETGEVSQDTLDTQSAVYWEGRSSNGPLAVEILADHLNAGITSYAIGGAKSDYGNEMAPMSPYRDTGLWGQTDKFTAELNGKQADPGALFFITVGGYDLSGYIGNGGDTSEEAINDFADQTTIANISKAVTSLTKAGAKQFMVVNAVDWNNMPAVKGTDLATPAKVFQKRLVSKVPAAMDDLAKQLNVRISVFDIVAALDQIRSKASQYGFTNLTDPCVTDPKCTKEKQDEYFWFTSIYLTRHVQQLLGEMMADEINKGL
jgi:cholinesterase